MKLSYFVFVFAGVYLSKYSDLLQINPFEVGSYGDMVVFKVMRVRLASVSLSCSLNSNPPGASSSSPLCSSGPRQTHPREHAQERHRAFAQV